MSIFAIADLHFSYGADKPMDIFPGWINYSDRIINNWNKLITDDDTVVIPGDISWSLKLEDTFSDFKILNELKGKKIILKGNHDLWWSTKKKLEDFLIANDFNTIKVIYNNSLVVDDYAICGSRGWYFDSETNEDKKIILRECGRIKTSIDEAKSTGKNPVLFLHYPPVMRDRECEEIMDLIIQEGIKECYYGHLHGQSKHNLSVVGNYKGINFHLISADYVNFTPVPVK